MKRNIQKCVSAMMVMSIIMQATPVHLYAAEQLYDIKKAQDTEVPNDENTGEQEQLQPVENDTQNGMGTEQQENEELHPEVPNENPSQEEEIKPEIPNVEQPQEEEALENVEIEEETQEVMEIQEVAIANEEIQNFDKVIWTNGITHPEKNDFQKIVEDNGQGVRYVTYKAPYQPNKGWYDINKAYKGADTNLCFAVAASNALHWWIDRNYDNLKKYAAQNPGIVNQQKLEEIKKIKQQSVTQKDSIIYDKFVRQFTARPSGYWSDILIDQFINGYKPKEDGGTNDGQNLTLLEDGPAKDWGYFYDVFGSIRVSERRHYQNAYDALSRDMKSILEKGDMLLLYYQTPGNYTHMVTLWGAEYDEKNNLSAIYVTDSDDPDPDHGTVYAMVRYNVKKHKDGDAMIYTDTSGKQGSKIAGIQVISQGKEVWEQRLKEKPEDKKIPLQLEWKNTTMEYNGATQAPSANAIGIEKYDDIGIFVDVPEKAFNKQKDVGEYSANAVIKGASAHRYEIPKGQSTKFIIKPAKPTVTLQTNVKENQSVKEVTFSVDVTGKNNEKPNGTVSLRTTGYEYVARDVPVVDGKATFTCSTIPSGKQGIRAKFFPATEGIGKNYTESESNRVNVTISNKQNQSIQIVPVTDKKFGDGTFTLEVTGGLGTGDVTYSCGDDGVLSIDGKTATIIGAGTTTITAIKEADMHYNSAIATYRITVAQTDAPEIVFPTTASSLVYGQKLSESVLSGEDKKYGTFVWEEGDVVPTTGNHDYTVKFVPSAETEKNYKPISTTTKKLNVSVSKATPVVTMKSEIAEQDGNRQVTLSASVHKVKNGNHATGKVTFVDCTAGQEKEIINNISVENGVATYTWPNAEKRVYKIKAVYGGNENYKPISSEIYTIDLTEHQQTKYSIAVVNDGHGEASANLLQAVAGNEVVLTAKPNDGFRFKEWEVLKGDVMIVENKFTMPAKEVEIRAIFEEDAYAVTIETDGHGEASANPEHPVAGDTVTLSTTPKEGFRFKEWKVLEGDVTVVNNTFTMPAKPVKIKAIFEKVEDQTKYPIIIESDGNGQANTNILQAVEGSTITLTATPNGGFRFKEWQVLEGDVTVVNHTFTMPAKPVKIKAIFERVTSGGGSGGGSSSKNPNTTDTQQEIGTKTETITKPDGSVVTTTKNDDGSSVIKVETKEGSTSVTTVDQEGNMKTEVKIPEKVMTETQESPVVLPIPPVVVDKETKNTQTIQVDTGNAKDVMLSVPMENPSTSMVVVVTEPDGTKEVMRKSVVQETGLTFLANGNMTIEIVDNHKTFTDVNHHWASNAIDFVSSHELYNGTSQNTFSPNATMTRAMLVQVLHNMEHNPKAENNQTFSDVKSSAWFADAVQWSVANGIVSGQDANTFAPQKNITREDLAVILYRYAGNPTSIGKELQFKDANQVSGYANDAIHWAVENGILNGTNQDTLNPKAAATRAEVAAVLMRFLNKTM